MTLQDADLDARDKDAVKEFHNYQMKESKGHGFSVVMGEDNVNYTVRSVMPFVKGVTPDGYEHFETASSWRRAQETTLLISILSFAAYLLNTQNSGLAYLAEGSALASIGLSFSWSGSLKEGVRIYNNDLASKLRSNYHSNQSP